MLLFRSEEANPQGQAYGDVCPAGSFCVEMSYAATPCEAGTYNPDQGSVDISDCLSCPSGKYCAVAGLANYTEECDAGM